MPTTPKHGIVTPEFRDLNWNQGYDAAFALVDARLPWAHEGDPNGEVAGLYVGQKVWDKESGFSWTCTVIGDAETAEWELSNIAADSVSTDAVEDEAITLDKLSPEVLQLIRQASHPVGSLFLSADDTNPSELLGFGTWEAYAQGRALVGVGQSVDVNEYARTITGGQVGGRWQHVQTIAQMPSHDHPGTYTYGAGGENSSAGRSTAGAEATNTDDPARRRTTVVSPQGGGSPMDWAQPFIGIYVWRRTA